MSGIFDAYITPIGMGDRAGIQKILTLVQVTPQKNVAVCVTPIASLYP